VSIRRGTTYALADSTPGRLHGVAFEWVEAEAPHRRFDLEAASGLLEQLAELARAARARDDGMYCWVCV
jgi:hypothetical protein